MGSRIIALLTLGIACVAAAGGGAYLAVRQNYKAVETAQTVTQPPAPESHATPAGMVTTPPSANEAALPPAAQPAASSTPQSPVAANEPPASTSKKIVPSTRRQMVEPAPTKRTARANFGDSQNMAAPATDGFQNTKPVTAPEQAAAANIAPPQPLNQVPAEPQHEFVEVTVPSESVLGLQLQTAITSETARVEDKVEAKVTRDVRVGDRLAIPAGSHVLGSVIQVDRGGKIKERAQFVIRFHTLVLADGTRTSITTEALHREGPSPTNKSAAKIGGATVGGAILGAILGGGKGAAIGGSIGAAGGTAAAMAGDREPATLPAGSLVNIRLMAPVTVTLER